MAPSVQPDNNDMACDDHVSSEAPNRKKHKFLPDGETPTQTRHDPDKHNQVHSTTALDTAAREPKHDTSKTYKDNDQHCN